MNRAQLLGHWVHAHEQDKGDETVFRRQGTALPPSRGRQAVELNDDGTLVDHPLRPDDRAGSRPGTWALEGDTLVLSAEGAPPRRFKVLAVNPTDLSLKRV